MDYSAFHFFDLFLLSILNSCIVLELRCLNLERGISRLVLGFYTFCLLFSHELGVRGGHTCHEGSQVVNLSRAEVEFSPITVLLKQRVDVRNGTLCLFHNADVFAIMVRTFEHLLIVELTTSH